MVSTLAPLLCFCMFSIDLVTGAIIPTFLILLAENEKFSLFPFPLSSISNNHP